VCEIVVILLTQSFLLVKMLADKFTVFTAIVIRDVLTALVGLSADCHLRETTLNSF